MHGAEHRSDRVVLKEDMVAAVNPAETVRVVQPSSPWPDVQRRKAWIGHGAKRYSTHQPVRVQYSRARLLARGESAARARDRLRGP